MACPMMKEAVSEHSQRTAAAISSGVPIRPIGSCAITLSPFLLGDIGRRVDLLFGAGVVECDVEAPRMPRPPDPAPPARPQFVAHLGVVVELGSWAEEDLDRSPLIHRPVTLGGLLERQFEVEDLARVDLAVPDQVDQFGYEAAHRSGSAVQVHV